MKTIMTGLIVVLLTACSRPIPEDIRTALDKQFSSEPLEKGWKFTKVTHGFGGHELVIDILVDAPIQSGAVEQRQFLKSKVCPASGNDDFWKKLQGYKLSIVAYTHDRKFTVISDCDNPYQAVAAKS